MGFEKYWVGWWGGRRRRLVHRQLRLNWGWPTPMSTHRYPLSTGHYPLPTEHYPLSTDHYPLSTTHSAMCPTCWWWTLPYPLPTEHWALLTGHSALPSTHWVLPTALLILPLYPLLSTAHPGPLLCTFHWMHLLAFARDTDAPFKQAFAADLLRKDRKSTQDCRCNFSNRLVALLYHFYHISL